MPAPSSRPPGRIIIVGLLVTAGLLLALAIWFAVRPAGRRATLPAVPETVEAVTPKPAARASIGTAPAPPAAEEAPPEPPIIDAVTIEKPEVCAGEENLITVKAHTPGGRDDAFLHYFVGTSPGRAVPVRAYPPAAGGEVPGKMQVQVFGRNNVVSTAPIPSYTVKRCKPDRQLFLRSRQMPNSFDEFELVAAVREIGPSPPLRITAYRWSFGDGASDVTAGPGTVHRYVPRDPDALYSEYLVACEAVGGDGRTVVGRLALSVKNLEAENLRYAETLQLSVELTPRFPELDSRGQVVERVRLYHHRSAPVRLERARVSYVGAGQQEIQPAQEPSVVEVLGTEEVPPGRGVERSFRFDTRAHADAMMVDYDLEGHTADGVRARAHFSLMRPPPQPTTENGNEVIDPLLTRKILRARERLGKAFVNDEDLKQLERDGAFADLEISRNDVAHDPEAAAAGVKGTIATKARGNQ